MQHNYIRNLARWFVDCECRCIWY